MDTLMPERYEVPIRIALILRRVWWWSRAIVALLILTAAVALTSWLLTPSAMPDVAARLAPAAVPVEPQDDAPEPPVPPEPAARAAIPAIPHAPASTTPAPAFEPPLPSDPTDAKQRDAQASYRAFVADLNLTDEQERRFRAVLYNHAHELGQALRLTYEAFEPDEDEHTSMPRPAIIDAYIASDYEISIDASGIFDDAQNRRIVELNPTMAEWALRLWTIDQFGQVK